MHLKLAVSTHDFMAQLAIRDRGISDENLWAALAEDVDLAQQMLHGTDGVAARPGAATFELVE